MAGFFSQALLIKSKSFCPIILLFLLLFLVLISSSSSSSLHDDHKTKPVIKASSVQVFYIKNTSPIFLDRQREPVGNKRKKKKTTMTMTTTMTRRKNIKNLKTNRPNFSVMLPKGFVPPSGSSPCHNKNPNSVVFSCDLGSSSKP